MLHTWELTIPQLEPADLRRRAYLYLPEAYDEDPAARFPVLYMFDGQNVFLDSDASFGRSWRMLDYLEASGAPVIVAAVESNPIGNNRLSWTTCCISARITGKKPIKNSLCSIFWSI